MNRTILFLLILLFVCIASQSDNKIKLEYPTYFPTPHYSVDNNMLDQRKVQLGRYLFYDPILSRDNSISCASCHSPYNAFAHTDHDLSHGIDDLIGTRNAPALFNLAWHPQFMWDGAINHLDMQALAPIEHPKEMDEKIGNVIDKLNGKFIYRKLFYEAYGDSSINTEGILKSLSQFQLTLISAGSKYDQMREGKYIFSEQEEKGYSLFKQHCNSCHTEPLFSNFHYVSNHLPIDSTLNDFGRGAITLQKKDSLTFKTPSLRNLSYSLPYMHDGRFKKLHQVLNHYTDSITIQEFEKDITKKPIRLSKNEKIDIISFLLTLNDPSFVFAKKHQFPKELLEQTNGN